MSKRMSAKTIFAGRGPKKFRQGMKFPPQADISG
jgi:hypothetical protein